MQSMTKRLLTGSIVIALSVAMVIPAVAIAAPAGPQAQPMADSRSQALEQRVMNALRNRAQRFENYANMLETQEQRMLELCETVEAAGGDCTQVREQLREATQTMERARTQEQLAAGMFKDVPGAGDKRGAFAGARNQARESVRTMKQSRDQLREAARLLRQVVRDVRADAEDTETE